MSIVDIVIYPVASCRGISLRRGTICPQGLLHDRTFVVVARKDESAPYKTVDIKSCPALVHVQPSIQGSQMYLTYIPTAKSIAVDLEPDTRDLKSLANEIMIWKFPYLPLDLGPEIGGFFKDVVKVRGSDVRLCYKSSMKRTIAGNMPPAAAQNYNKNIEAGFHAAFPLLLVSMSSLRDLNSRLAENDQVEIERFRANIIIEDLEPWDEDDWSTIRLNASQGERQRTVHITSRCGRCSVVTVSLDHAKSGGQPLREMRKFRNIDPGELSSSPVFGMYGGLSQPATVF